MWTFPRVAVVAVAVVLLASGCAPTTREGPKDPSPRAAPVFASEAEALAAATEAYAAYVKVSDAITQDGGINPERITELVTKDYLADERRGFASFEASGLVTRGDSTFDGTRLQEFSSDAQGRSSVTIYVCYDISRVQLINSAGEDVTPPSRANRQALEVTLSTTSDPNSKMLIARSETWPNEGICS
jgi:hypothetical protein